MEKNKEENIQGEQKAGGSWWPPDEYTVRLIHELWRTSVEELADLQEAWPQKCKEIGVPDILVTWCRELCKLVLKRKLEKDRSMRGQEVCE